jgi:hypothetical protein
MVAGAVAVMVGVGIAEGIAVAVAVVVAVVVGLGQRWIKSQQIKGWEKWEDQLKRSTAARRKLGRFVLRRRQKIRLFGTLL